LLPRISQPTSRCVSWVSSLSCRLDDHGGPGRQKGRKTLGWIATLTDCRYLRNRIVAVAEAASKVEGNTGIWLKASRFWCWRPAGDRGVHDGVDEEPRKTVAETFGYLATELFMARRRRRQDQAATDAKLLPPAFPTLTRRRRLAPAAIGRRTHPRQTLSGLEDLPLIARRNRIAVNEIEPSFCFSGIRHPAVEHGGDAS
jgi:hypothetical protein